MLQSNSRNTVKPSLDRTISFFRPLMILDQVYRAIGCSWAYPVKQLLLLNFVLFLCTHNLQKVPLLSWSPDVFCAIKNESGKRVINMIASVWNSWEMLPDVLGLTSTGLYPYNYTENGPQYFPLSARCTIENDGSLDNCTVSKWMEKNPKNPKCSPFAVKPFPICDQNNSV